MKTLATALLLTFSFLTSQINSQFLTGFGVKGGVTFGLQKYDGIPGFNFSTKPVTGLNAGLYAEMLNNKHINIVIDAGYEQRGSRLEIIRTDEFGNNLGTYDEITKTQYLTFGALSKIKYESGSITPYLLIGPRIDVYLGYTLTFSIPVMPIAEEQEFKSIPHEDTKKLNYSLNLGAGLQFEKLLPFKTLIEFNYSPEINTSYQNQAITLKDSYYNLKVGINFVKSKTKKTKYN